MERNHFFFAKEYVHIANSKQRKHQKFEFWHRTPSSTAVWPQARTASSPKRCGGAESPVLRNKEDRPEAAEHSRSRTRNQRWIDFLRSTPVANTETMLLVYGLFQKGRVLAQDGEKQIGRTYGAPRQALDPTASPTVFPIVSRDAI